MRLQPAWRGLAARELGSKSTAAVESGALGKLCLSGAHHIDTKKGGRAAWLVLLVYAPKPFGSPWRGLCAQGRLASPRGDRSPGRARTLPS